jgi:hypothetical protein
VFDDASHSEGGGEGDDPYMPYKVGDLVNPTAEYTRLNFRGQGPGLIVHTQSPWFVRVKWHNLKHAQGLHIKFVELHTF